MRKAINDNPMVQIAVIGVLVVVVGLFMMMNMKKGGSSSSSTSSATPGVSSSPVGGTAVPVTPDGTVPPSTSGGSVGVTPPATSGTVTPDALIPGPGLPKNVIDAWKHGDAVVLLISGGGIDDRLVRESVESLSGDARTSVFVARAKDVARYSRITQGVGVDRVPALVVVRPRSKGGSVPEAQVSYGFRNSQSVVQAVHDALYNGRDDLPYSPR
ncbi:MAG: hypothetical protein ACJ75Z_04645 [Solirubrobacterales bacterium]